MAKMHLLLLIPLLAFQLAFALRTNEEYEALLQRFNSSGYKPSVAPPNLPVNVTIQIYMRRLIVEDEETYPYFVAEFTMREFWTDARLKSENAPDSVTLPDDDKNFQLWTPDTFFQNDMGSKPIERDNLNNMVRIYKNGNILFSTRQRQKFTCALDLWHYPYDRHVCYISIGSYKHTTEYVNLTWKNQDNVLTFNWKNLTKDFQIEFSKSWMKSGVSRVETGDYAFIEAAMVFSRLGDHHYFELFVVPSVAMIFSFLAFVIPNWQIFGHLLLMATMAVFIIGICLLYSNFPLARFGIPHRYYTACGSIMIAEMFTLLILNYVLKWYESRIPPEPAHVQLHELDDNDRFNLVMTPPANYQRKWDNRWSKIILYSRFAFMSIYVAVYAIVCMAITNQTVNDYSSVFDRLYQWLQN